MEDESAFLGTSAYLTISPSHCNQHFTYCEVSICVFLQQMDMKNENRSLISKASALEKISFFLFSVKT